MKKKEHISSFEIMRRTNLEKVYLTILAHHPISRIDISTKTGLNKMTVTNCVRTLLEAKLIFEWEVAETSTGRPPIYLELNYNYGIFIGIEINYLSTKILVTDIVGRVLEQRVDPDVAKRPRNFIIEVSELVKKYQHGYPQFENGVVAVSIALPGNYDEETGMVEFIANMPQWNGFNIREELKKEIPKIPIFFQNTGRAGAKGEVFSRKVAAETNLAYIQGSKGLGLSIYSRGSEIISSTGYQGRFGHMIIDVDGRECSCGNRGCLERYASIDALGDMLYPGEPMDNELCAEIIRRAKNPDKEMTAALETVIKYLSVGLANIINCFNPQKICIGNYLGMALKGKEKDINEAVNRLLVPFIRDPHKVYISDLDEWGASYGCIALVRGEMLYKAL